MTSTSISSRPTARERKDGSAKVSDAEAWLAKRFKRTRVQTLYIAGFEIGGGREVAIDRTCQNIQIWLASKPRTMDGVRILNRWNPGQPYAATQRRNSNLRAATPTLATGHLAYHVEVDDLATLPELF